jgi:Domain of unknown function (DUF1707)
MASPNPATRIGATEREAAQRALQEHLNAGRLQVNEYADRSANASDAVTASELAALFADLPAPHPKLPGSPLGVSLRTLMFVVVVAAVVVLAGLFALVIGLSGRDGPSPSSGTVAGPAPGASPPLGPAVPPTAPLETPGADVGAGGAVLPGGETVRRTTGGESITLRPSYGVDLDDDTSPNWSVGRGCCDRDVGWDGDGSRLYLSNDHAVMTGSPGYAACARETGYSDKSIERGSLQSGQNICVRTSGKRFALVTIVSTSEQAIQFRAIVWDPPIPS